MLPGRRKLCHVYLITSALYCIKLMKDHNVMYAYLLKRTYVSHQHGTVFQHISVHYVVDIKDIRNAPKTHKRINVHMYGHLQVRILWYGNTSAVSCLHNLGFSIFSIACGDGSGIEGLTLGNSSF